MYLCLILPILISSCRSTNKSAVSEDTLILSQMNIQKITCKSILANANDLVITRSISELPFASYHVDIDGRNIILGDAPSVRQTDDSFMVQKIIDIGQRQDIEVSAGINMINGQFEGFYMEAANGGLSPLPGISFKPCVIEEVSLDDGLGSATGDANCRVDNVMVLNGSSVDSSDGCNSCTCNNGSFACTEIA